MGLLQARLAQTRGRLADGVRHGLVTIAIDPGQVDDPAGSDRRAGWERDGDLARLAADIARRGQRQPIRVRPADPAWQPGAEDPTDPGDARFVIQSGRRRLECARRLGIPVRAVVATETGEAARADLEERFLENTMRKALTGFEELLSIGLIAEAQKDLAQAEIAARLQVPPGDVSLGLACVELAETIRAIPGAEAWPKRAFRDLIPKLRRGSTDKDEAPAGRTPPEAAAGRAPEARVSRRLDGQGAEARLGPRGLTVTLPGWQGEAEAVGPALEALLAALATRRG